MSFHGLLTQRATLEQSTITRSSTGEETDTWTAKASDVPCLVRPATRPRDVPVFSQEEISHIVYLDVYTPILSGRWRILIGAREYRVVAVDDPGGRGHHYEVSVRLVA